jgi:4-carboxymuconolactone decarboxylase
MRRKVLGAEYADTAEARLNDFNSGFQDLSLRYVWGDLWSRPGLEPKIRSMLTLMALMAQNRQDEFKLHVRAAFNNGVTRDEIREVILHGAAYCGVPAANGATRWAGEVIAELDAAGGKDGA